MRAADRAGVGLRVKAAVARVVVFGLALRAHRERFHRGVRAVVGQGFDDAEARAAVRAVGERIAVTAVLRIENLAQTIGTGGDVRQHQRGFVTAGFAFADFKILVSDRIEPGSFEALNETARGFFGFEAEQEFFERCARAFDFDEDALWRIVDPAGEFQSRWRGGRRTGGNRRPGPRRERRVSAVMVGAAGFISLLNCKISFVCNYSPFSCCGTIKLLAGRKGGCPTPLGLSASSTKPSDQIAMLPYAHPARNSFHEFPAISP